MNKREVRIFRIIQKLREDPFISIADLAQLFHVSQMTIRRDLQYIEENGLQPQLSLADAGGAAGRQGFTAAGSPGGLNGAPGSTAGINGPAIGSPGGLNGAPGFTAGINGPAIGSPGGLNGAGGRPVHPAGPEKNTETGAGEYYLPMGEDHCIEEKRRINAFAASLLRPGDVIVLDSGTTAGMLPDMIPDDLPLTVICYSYYIVSRLCDKPNVRLILAGGYYHRNTKVFSSEEGISFMRQLRAHKVFLCASGIHADMGLTCTDQYIGDMKRAAISMSLEKILIADSSKFGRVDPGYFASIEDMDRIITDTGISEEWADLIRDKGVRLDLV